MSRSLTSNRVISVASVHLVQRSEGGGLWWAHRHLVQWVPTVGIGAVCPGEGDGRVAPGRAPVRGGGLGW